MRLICASMQHDYGIPLIGHTMYVEGVVYFGAYVDPCVLLEFSTLRSEISLSSKCCMVELSFTTAAEPRWLWL